MEQIFPVCRESEIGNLELFKPTPDSSLEGHEGMHDRRRNTGLLQMSKKQQKKFKKIESDDSLGNSAVPSIRSPPDSGTELSQNVTQDKNLSRVDWTSVHPKECHFVIKIINLIIYTLKDWDSNAKYDVIHQTNLFNILFMYWLLWIR